MIYLYIITPTNEKHIAQLKYTSSTLVVGLTNI